tara:strand:- start:7449 stop:7571 length:123 start_codon:yes stop_codon:yes gene_type:complete
MTDTEEIYVEVADIDPDLVENASDLEELIELLLFLGFPTI